MLITLGKYLEYLDQGTVPPCAPYFSADMSHPSYDDVHDTRRECNLRGMWPMVEKSWVSRLAAWIGERSVLEVMAGARWLSKALSEEGVNIVATDDFSWDGIRHEKMHKRVYPVVAMDALQAVEVYGNYYDILLVSWPPYQDQTITEVLEAWGHNRPVIYIGEGAGGCTGDTSLFKVFKADTNAPDIGKVRWPGHYDDVYLGRVCIPEVADWLNLHFVLDVMEQGSGSYEYVGKYYLRLERKIGAHLSRYYNLHGVYVEVDYNYIVISDKTNTFYVYNTPEMREWLSHYGQGQFCISPARIVIEDGVATVEKVTL